MVAYVNSPRCPWVPPPGWMGKMFHSHGPIFVAVRGFRRLLCRGLASALGAGSSLLRLFMSMLSFFQ